MTRTIIKALASFLLSLAILAGAVVLFLKPVSEMILQNAGFPIARVGHAALETDGFTLREVVLGNGVTLASARALIDFESLLARKINSVALRIEGGKFVMPTLWGLLPIEGTGTANPYGEGWRWNADITADATFMRFMGRLTADVIPGQPRENHFEVIEGRVDIPGFSARRVTGWISAGPKGMAGQLMAGTAEGEGIGLQDVTVTLAENGELLMSGTPRGGARLYIDFRREGITCNGRPAPFAVAPLPQEIMKLAKACAERK